MAVLPTVARMYRSPFPFRRRPVEIGPAAAIEPWASVCRFDPRPPESEQRLRAHIAQEVWLEAARWGVGLLERERAHGGAVPSFDVWVELAFFRAWFEGGGAHPLATSASMRRDRPRLESLLQSVIHVVLFPYLCLPFCTDDIFSPAMDRNALYWHPSSCGARSNLLAKGVMDCVDLALEARAGDGVVFRLPLERFGGGSGIDYGRVRYLPDPPLGEIRRFPGDGRSA